MAQNDCAQLVQKLSTALPVTGSVNVNAILSCEINFMTVANQFVARNMPWDLSR